MTWIGPSAALRMERHKPVPVSIAARIEDEWKVYALSQPAGGPTPLSIAVGGAVPFALRGQPTGPTPALYPDRNFDIMSEVHRDSARFALRLVAGAGAKDGPGTVPILVRYQSCTDRYCLPPRTDTVHVPVRVAVHRRPTATA